jgi:menaquinone C8-methyltransferase
MIVEALLTKLLRRVSRRTLRFPASSGGVQLPAPAADERFLLYLHVPYCVVLCPFCSFHRVRFREDSARRYFEALRREIRLVGDAGFRFDEIYLGGGTPTVQPAELLRTLEVLRQKHPIRATSVETNPDDLGKDSIRQLRDAGVSRLSVGVQSFDDTLLHEMQRLETYGSGSEIAARLRRQHGMFDTVNVDMIFNFPHQTEASLRRDLDILIDDVGAEQVSWYPLIEDASTRRSMQKSMGRIDYSRERGMYGMIAERMLAAGYRRTSAWCFSRKAGLFDEYIVDHEEYVGLGSGAFSYLRGGLYASTFSINHYLRLVESGRTGTMQCRAMSNRDRMRYYLLMRLFGGSLDLAAAESRFDGRFGRTLRAELAALRSIRALRRSGDTLQLTEYGYYLWAVMMREFFSGVSRLREAMRHHIAAEHDGLAPDRQGGPAAGAQHDFGKPQ